jgi:hypothetical protein
MSLHHLGVADFAATADNPYFVMAGFAAITDYFYCRSRFLATDYHQARWTADGGLIGYKSAM